MLTLQHYGAPVAQEANILVFMIVFINNLHGYHELFKRIFGWGGGGPHAHLLLNVLTNGHGHRWALLFIIP